MSVFASPRFLRNVLIADAASGAATGLLHLLAGAALAQWLGLPVPLLVASGALLFGYVALAGYLASCDPVPRPLAWTLVAANWAWVAACLVLLFGGVVPEPTLLGKAYLVVQALAVAVLAEVQWACLRRTPVVGWA
ncbi:MAG: hypothetical protein EOO25_08885 [Comamonadaceae bacterium]|nr:MAG: hypothetical protein EOO25_08885 [Comamonadaceae bacterium]